MNPIFTDSSFQNIIQVANRYGITTNSTTDLTHALMMSNGTMAQFNISELGGGGQWMQGGMTMVGDMFNYQLKGTVNGICSDLSNLIYQGAIQYKPIPVVRNENSSQTNFSGNWWGDLGQPNSTGSQNNMNYAVFSNIGRLAIQQNGEVTIFNTLDHQIGGVGQQQGGNYSVSFTSQYGNVDLGTLPIISDDTKNQAPVQNTNFVENIPSSIIQEVVKEAPYNKLTNENPELEEDIFTKIEKLAALKDKNILSVEEFENKKLDLLSRL